MTHRLFFYITFFFIVLHVHVPITCADHALQPLPFNNPSLNVDLGVGLWAWPMPMDYDGDGDHDLLVACPDKPSNGVYFFENKTQDPRQATPVFERAVKLGSATQNMQVSYVHGQPHILIPGKEISRDNKTNRFDFNNLKRIYPTSNIHSSPVRGNMWRYVDFDGDGDHDILVGVGDWQDYGWDHAYDNMGHWKNGLLHGFVYLIRNSGTDAMPVYSEMPSRLRAGGGDIDVYGWPSPNFGDFDGDGDLDLICGEFLDGFTYFQNQGTRKHPEYAAGVRLRCADGQPLHMHLQMITPTAFDWDHDGDLDLIVGDEDGRVAFVEHQGTTPNGLPQFSIPFYFQQKADTLKFGALATPYAYDLDSDGDEDIVCGNTAGNIAVFTNLGCLHGTLPTWSAPQLIQLRRNGNQMPFRIMAEEKGSIQGPCEAKWGYTTLSVGDWDNDGDGDILFNSILSQLGLLIREEDYYKHISFEDGPFEHPPRWYWWKGMSTASLTQWRTTPIMIDFDNDTLFDLILLDQEGYLTLRRRDPQTQRVGNAQRCFVDTHGNPIRLNPRSAGRSGRIKLNVVDWDGDGFLDILVNSENAVLYRNVAREKGKIFLHRVGNLTDRNIAGHTSSPATCDFDQDGKPDLLIGAEDGRLYYANHKDCNDFSNAQMQASFNHSDQKASAVMHEEFIFDKPPTPQCHASTICMTSRGLAAAWFAGTQEKNKDVCIWTSYHDGSQWSKPVRTATGIQHGDLRHPCWNPVLFQPPDDGPLLLFFKVGPDPRSWWG
ncbi:MAG: FG-GAP-like repeat-containing protein, partial [Pirellulales bacterium]